MLTIITLIEEDSRPIDKVAWAQPVEKFTVATLIRWVRTYKEEGPQGLESYARAKEGDRRKGRKIARKVLDEVIRIKKEKPQSGLMYNPMENHETIRNQEFSLTLERLDDGKHEIGFASFKLDLEHEEMEL